MKSAYLCIKLIFAGFFIPAGVSEAQTIFVSPDGNDRNPGTSRKPLATLAAAQDKARALRKQSQPEKPQEIIVRKGESLPAMPERI